MRGLKSDRGESVAICGQAFIQNLRRGHYEFGVEARRLVEQLAVTWTANLLVQHGDQDVADTYFRSRLDHDWASEFGTLPADAPLQRIANRAVPST